MKANEAPEKIYSTSNENKAHYYTEGIPFERDFVEYTRTDAFIEKAKKWFEKYNEWFDPSGNRHCDLDDFEDFKKYMKGK